MPGGATGARASEAARGLTDAAIELLAHLVVQLHLVRGRLHPAGEQRAVRLVRVRVPVRFRFRVRVRVRVRVGVRVRVRIAVRVRVRARVRVKG